MLRIAFRIPAEAREDVLDGVLPLFPAGSWSGSSATGRWSCRRWAATVLPGPDELRAAAGGSSRS